VYYALLSEDPWRSSR